MSLNQERLKNKIATVLDECQQETTDPNESKNKLADRLATAIIDEIKQLKITYSNGLVAPSGAGPVTGSLNVTIS